MHFKSVVVLTVAEAREDLVWHYTRFFVNNPHEFANLLRDGKLTDLPNLALASDKEVIQMYRENQVGAALLGEKVDSVYVQSGTSLEVVYEKS